MALPVINFAALQPQGDPAAAGALRALQQGFALGVAPFQAHQDLKQKKLANALAEIQLQYAPQMNQAELGYKQAQIPNLQAQTQQTQLQSQYYPQDIMSQIAQRGAQTDVLKQEAKFYPLDKLIGATNAQRLSSRFGNYYQLAKLLGEMPSAQRAQWQADHPQEYADLVNSLANQASQQQQSATDDTLSNALSQYFPGMMKKLPQTNQQANMLQQAAPGPMTVGPFKTTPEQATKLGNIASMQANKILTTAATQRQAEGAQQVETIINDPEFNTRAQDAFKYAGAMKLGKKALDSINQSNPQSYNNYLTFMSNDMPLVASRIKTLDQMGATDKQREVLERMYQQTMFSMTSNPERAAQLFENLKTSLNNVSRAVLTSAQPAGDTGRYGNVKKAETYSEEDLKHTAQKHGLTVDQVKQQLGMR